jgi:hypothetical protein
MFAAPEWAAGRFAWAVSPFVAMTIGAWCLGNSVYALSAIRAMTWDRAYGAFLYLGAFAVLQTLVLVAFRDRLVTDVVLSWPYMAVLAVGVVGAFTGLVEWTRASGATRRGKVGAWVRVALAAFFILVGGLAVLGGRAQAGGRSTEGGIFPEPLSLFSVRAFAAFFGALAISSLPLVWARSGEPIRLWLRSGLALIVPILVAAFAHRDAFSVDAGRGGLIYVSAYVLALVGAVVILMTKTGRNPPRFCP